MSKKNLILKIASYQNKKETTTLNVVSGKDNEFVLRKMGETFGFTGVLKFRRNKKSYYLTADSGFTLESLSEKLGDKRYYKGLYYRTVVLKVKVKGSTEVINDVFVDQDNKELLKLVKEELELDWNYQDIVLKITNGGKICAENLDDKTLEDFISDEDESVIKVTLSKQKGITLTVSTRNSKQVVSGLKREISNKALMTKVARALGMRKARFFLIFGKKFVSTKFEGYSFRECVGAKTKKAECVLITEKKMNGEKLLKLLCHKAGYRGKTKGCYTAIPMIDFLRHKRLIDEDLEDVVEEAVKVYMKKFRKLDGKLVNHLSETFKNWDFRNEDYVRELIRDYLDDKLDFGDEVMTRVKKIKKKVKEARRLLAQHVVDQLSNMPDLFRKVNARGKRLEVVKGDIRELAMKGVKTDPIFKLVKLVCDEGEKEAVNRAVKDGVDIFKKLMREQSDMKALKDVLQKVVDFQLKTFKRYQEEFRRKTRGGIFDEEDEELNNMIEETLGGAGEVKMKIEQFALFQKETYKPLAEKCVSAMNEKIAYINRTKDQISGGGKTLEDFMTENSFLNIENLTDLTFNKYSTNGIPLNRICVYCCESTTRSDQACKHTTCNSCGKQFCQICLNPNYSGRLSDWTCGHYNAPCVNLANWIPQNCRSSAHPYLFVTQTPANARSWWIGKTGRRGSPSDLNILQDTITKYNEKKAILEERERNPRPSSGGGSSSSSSSSSFLDENDMEDWFDAVDEDDDWGDNSDDHEDLNDMEDWFTQDDGDEDDGDEREVPPTPGTGGKEMDDEDWFKPKESESDDSGSESDTDLFDFE